MRNIRTLLVAASLFTALGSTGIPVAADTPPAGAPDLASHSLGTWGVELSDRDPTVKPGDNFYLSQNGGRLKRQPCIRTA